MFPKSRLPNQKGFTFIEVMVTLIILSTGIVAIFKSFLISLNQIDYLTHRLHASIALENTLFQKERMLKNYKELSLDLGEKKVLEIGNKTIQLNQKLSLSEIESYPDLFKIDLSLTWKERERDITLKRASYIYDARYQYKVADR